jgi:hypothetical protein
VADIGKDEDKFIKIIMIKLLKKIKDTPGGFHEWWESDKGMVRKPKSSAIKSEPKVEETIKETIQEPIMKSIFKSKLFWLGIINVATGVLQYIGGALDTGTAITVNGIIIIILRYITNQPVKIK